jgi:hypothetical protein
VDPWLAITLNAEDFIPVIPASNLPNLLGLPALIKILQMTSDVVGLPGSAGRELERILSDGGFEVERLGETSRTDEAHAYLCRRAGAAVSVSMAVAQDGSDPPYITVTTIRKVFGIWLRPRDRRLVRDVVAYLLSYSDR